MQEFDEFRDAAISLAEVLVGELDDHSTTTIVEALKRGRTEVFILWDALGKMMDERDACKDKIAELEKKLAGRA